MLFETLSNWAVKVIEAGGPVGAGALMALESMIAPIPSEAVMPFVGFLVAQGKMSWAVAVGATTAGSVVGSLISYCMGRYGGKPLVLGVGRYLMLNEHHLDLTTEWFHKRGSLTVFVSRFIPIVRHLISIPAGMGAMPLVPFVLYTALGATMWNSLLLVLGYKLQQHWTVVHEYGRVVDVILVLGVVAAATLWWWLHRTRKKPA